MESPREEKASSPPAPKDFGVEEEREMDRLLVTCRGDLGRLDLGLRIKPLDAIGTNSVSKIGIRMGADIRFDLLPIPLIVANLFAGGANGQQAAEGLDMR